MGSLFEAAGYKDYEKMEQMKFYPPKTNISISSFEDGVKIRKKITGLVYKGKCNDGVLVSSTGGTFLGTKQHLIWDDFHKTFITLDQGLTELKGRVTGVDESGKQTPVYLEENKEEFDVLDIEVEGTHTYFSAGVLSHNTFGGSAKGLAEGLRKMNIFCSNFDTTLFTISQERANMNAMSHMNAVTGGFASKYYPSTRNKITKTDVIKEGAETIGICIRCRNFKNKAGVPFRDSNMNLYFGIGSNGIRGFDSDSEFLQFFFDLKLVEQHGAYFKSDEFGFNLNGRAKVQDWMEAHQDEYSILKTRVTEMLSGATQLDINNEDPNLDDDGPSEEEKDFIEEEIKEDETEESS
jgi:hypothetical protein